jgi:hypothetical protein
MRAALTPSPDMTRTALLLAMLVHAGMAVDTLNKCWAVCGKAPAPYVQGHSVDWQTQGFRNKREAKSGESDGGGSTSASGEDSDEDSTERKKKKDSVTRSADQDSTTNTPNRGTTSTRGAPRGGANRVAVRKNVTHTANQDNATRIEDQDTRIVNGYDPDERPWLALLDVSGGSCGGALINKR